MAPVEGSVEEGGAFLASVEDSVEADGLMAVVSHAHGDQGMKVMAQSLPTSLQPEGWCQDQNNYLG